MDSFELVPRPRLELGRLAALVSETSASTNSATWGILRMCFINSQAMRLEGILMRFIYKPHRCEVYGVQEMGQKPLASFFASFLVLAQQCQLCTNPTNHTKPNLADAVGFEPTEGFPPRWFSRPVP